MKKKEKIMYGQFGRGGGYLTYNFVHIISTSLLISVSIPFLHPPKKWETISMLIYMYFFIGKFKKKNCLLREKVWWYVPEIFTQLWVCPQVVFDMTSLWYSAEKFWNLVPLIQPMYLNFIETRLCRNLFILFSRKSNLNVGISLSLNRVPIFPKHYD